MDDNTAIAQPADQPEKSTVSTRETIRWVGLYVALSIICGLIGAAVWVNVVKLPTYYVLPDSQARINERGLTQFFNTDAWFVVIGGLIGLGLGWISWQWLRQLRWKLVLCAALGAELSALCCWGLGSLLGPENFRDRLAQAKPGTDVPIDFKLTSLSALAVWPFAATLVILLFASLLPEPTTRRKRRSDLPETADTMVQPSDLPA